MFYQLSLEEVFVNLDGKLGFVLYHVRMDYQILVAGKGGQGVLLFTKVLGCWAVRKNIPVFATETHGMATRGGSVISHVKLGRHFYPVIQKKKADIVVVLAESELNVAKEYLCQDGLLFINTNNIKGERIYSIDANYLAQKHLGSLLFVNLIMLGYMGKIALNVSLDDLKLALKMALENNKYLDKNIKALSIGFAEAKDVAA